jgi:hypothetical protein
MGRIANIGGGAGWVFYGYTHTQPAITQTIMGIDLFSMGTHWVIMGIVGTHYPTRTQPAPTLKRGDMR